MPSVPDRSFGPPHPDAIKGIQKVKKKTARDCVSISKFVGQTSCIRTVLIVDVSADDILDPGEVGRRSSEHRGLLIHNTSNRTEARYAMNLPRTTGGILTHQRTT